MENSSSTVWPFGLVPSDLMVRVLPSAESRVVSVLVTLPLSLYTVSQVEASICFHASVVPSGSG
jgi:hypothetical protein